MNGNDRPRVTLVTSNGWGLGHLSRAIAIAIAIGERADVTMFSFSRGLPLASRFGTRGEFCPGPISTWIPQERWNEYVLRRFELFLSEVEADVVLFDGVAPYLGVINALSEHPAISAGWLRRGMWQRSRTEAQLTKSSDFDFVIEPGDLASEVDQGPTSQLEAIRVAPVSLLEVIPLLDREEAASELGLDPVKPTLLFAVGSGQPGETEEVRRAALERALGHDAWQVGVVKSPLSTRELDEAPGVVELEGVYPLMRYLAAFDAAISAAGYNSVHELIPAGVPTLLVPKSASNTDDQMTRASFLAGRGLALMAEDDDLDGVRRQVDSLLSDGGERLRASLADHEEQAMTGGAHEIADTLTSSPPTRIRKTAPAEEEHRPWFKGSLKRAIGPRGVELVQRALGREPEMPRRAVVSLNGDDAGIPRLVVTSDLEAVARSAEHPVEHILPGATAGYEELRHSLIKEFYEVVP